MIEITFLDFYEYKYDTEEFYQLYVMKNGLDEILYIGISSQNIWNRWFGWTGHITVGPRFLVGESPIGRKVINHLPDAWGWKIQLWTLSDCVEFCTDELSNSKARFDIKMLEPFMIQKLRPSLNTIYNLNPGIDHTPMSERERQHQAKLDDAFREIFEKRAKGRRNDHSY